MDENGFRLNEGAWEVARVLSVAKTLSLETLNEMGNLLFAYLIDGLDPTVTADMQHLRYSSVIGRIKDEIGPVKSSESLDVVYADEGQPT